MPNIYPTPSNIIKTTLAPDGTAPQDKPAPRRTNRAAVTGGTAPVLPDDLVKLIATQSQWKGAVTERQERQVVLDAELQTIIARIVDSTGQTQIDLRKERAALIAENDLIQAELVECQRRYDTARLAVLDFKIQAAEAIYKAADGEARAKREVLLAAQNRNLRFMNAGGRHGQSDESILQKKTDCH